MFLAWFKNSKMRGFSQLVLHKTDKYLRYSDPETRGIGRRRYSNTEAHLMLLLRK